MQNVKTNAVSTKKLCFAAALAALFVVLDILSISIGNNIKITFGGLPIIIAAIYLGPLYGTVVGLIGSFFGQLFTYGLSPTTVVWIIPAGIRGLSMGLLFAAFRRNFNWVSVGVSILTSSLLVTVFNTFAIYIDSKVFGYYSIAVVFGATVFRVISGILTSIAYLLIIFPIVKVLDGRIRL